MGEAWTLSPDEAAHGKAADDACCVGQSLHGEEIGGPTRAGKPWQGVNRLHHDLDQASAKRPRLATSGGMATARGLYAGEYSERPEKPLRALRKCRSAI